MPSKLPLAYAVPAPLSAAAARAVCCLRVLDWIEGSTAGRCCWMARGTENGATGPEGHPSRAKVRVAEPNSFCICMAIATIKSI